MKIEIEADLAEELKSAVAAGRYTSVEEAVRAAVERLILEDDDMAWAKPLVDEARAAIERGDFKPLATVRAEMREHLSQLKRK